MFGLPNPFAPPPLYLLPFTLPRGYQKEAEFVVFAN